MDCISKFSWRFQQRIIDHFNVVSSRLDDDGSANAAKRSPNLMLRFWKFRIEFYDRVVKDVRAWDRKQIFDTLKHVDDLMTLCKVPQACLSADETALSALSLGELLKILFVEDLNKRTCDLDMLGDVFCAFDRTADECLKKANIYGNLYLSLTNQLDGLASQLCQHDCLKLRFYGITFKLFCVSFLLSALSNRPAVSDDYSPHQIDCLLFFVAYLSGKYCPTYYLTLKRDQTFFSHARNDADQWFFRIFMPFHSMPNEDSESVTPKRIKNKKLAFCLRHHSLEAKVELGHSVSVSADKSRIEVKVSLIHFCCSVIPLVCEQKMRENGMKGEKPFPSKLRIIITPESNIHKDFSTVLPSKESESCRWALTDEKGWEMAQKASVNCKSVSLSMLSKQSSKMATQVTTPLLRYEQFCKGTCSGGFRGTLIDPHTRTSVISVKYDREATESPLRWLSDARSPLNEDGGFDLLDPGGQCPITWVFKSSALGKTVKWTVKVVIWTTYWPCNNRRNESFYETRKSKICYVFPLRLGDPSESSVSGNAHLSPSLRLSNNHPSRFLDCNFG